MKQLNISITKAALKSFDVSIDDKGKPNISATINLMTDGGKVITTYTISTNSWTEKNKFDLPLDAIEPMARLARILEGVVVRHCNDSQKGLGSGSVDELMDMPF